MAWVHRMVVLMVSALVLVAAGVVYGSRSEAADSYRYFGSREPKILHTHVTLDTATLNDSQAHVAVWLGANTPDISRWVQAGIADAGNQTFEYIEVKRPNAYPVLYSWPTTFGYTAAVSLGERWGRWRVVIDGHVSRWVWMKQHVVTSTLEIEGDASGSGVIGRRVVRG